MFESISSVLCHWLYWRNFFCRSMLPHYHSFHSYSLPLIPRLVVHMRGEACVWEDGHSCYHAHTLHVLTHFLSTWLLLGLTRSFTFSSFLFSLFQFSLLSFDWLSSRACEGWKRWRRGYFEGKLVQISSTIRYHSTPFDSTRSNQYTVLHTNYQVPHDVDLNPLSFFSCQACIIYEETPEKFVQLGRKSKSHQQPTYTLALLYGSFIMAAAVVGGTVNVLLLVLVLVLVVLATC